MALMKSDLALQKELGNTDRYNQILDEIVATDPNNPTTYFILAETASESEEYDKAASFYKKALDFDPENSGAMINFGAMKLKKEGEIVDQMNSLGTSRADDAKYEALKKERDQIYNEVLPYFEKAAILEPENTGLLNTLVSIYGQLGLDDKAKILKEKISQQGGQE